MGYYNRRIYISTAIIISAASTITGSIISVPTSTTGPRQPAQPPTSRDPLVVPPVIYQQGKYDDQHSDDDESGHGYLKVQYSHTVMLNKSRRATGSIRMWRSIIVVEIPPTILQ